MITPIKFATDLAIMLEREFMKSQSSWKHEIYCSIKRLP